MGRYPRQQPSATQPTGPMALAEALDAWIQGSGLRKRLDLATAVAEWPGLVGPQISAVTQAFAVTPDGTLLVRVATPAWATELGLMTPRILTRLNGSRAGRVQHIRWMVGPLDRP
jgi:predicted nucleic acid-binding Zn ribbon protein